MYKRKFALKKATLRSKKGYEKDRRAMAEINACDRQLSEIAGFKDACRSRTKYEQALQSLEGNII
ncbi:MAG TPA: hypothetical protein DD412_02110 [Holosporales bacterium]|nr:hypothetical protein [Holosporales bacterium]